MTASALGLSTGEVFAGRYRVIEEIGRGGMGRVYKVLDTKIQEKIALKIISPEVAADERVLARFHQELKLARQVTHKNVCRVFDIGEADGKPYITMEFCPGDTLRGIIAKTGALNIATSVDFGRQICAGLAEAHKLGIVHRDLKPRNLIIDESQSLRIMDFGIARTGGGEPQTRENVILGTPDYMAPEQIDGAAVDARTDIYALGIILYEMVTGRPPFEADSTLGLAFKQKNERPRPPVEENPFLPAALNALILRCLEKDRARRYPDVGAVLADLGAIAGDLGPTGIARPTGRATPVSGFRPARSRSRRLRRWAAGAAVVLLAGGLAALLSLNAVREPAPSGWDDKLAVLPFRDLSGERSRLAEDMMIDVWTKLNNAGFKKLVRPSSSGQFRNLRPRFFDRLKTTKTRLAEIGRILGARYIMTGSVRAEGEKLSFHASLYDAQTRETTWTRPFGGQRSQYLIVDEDIVAGVAEFFRAKAERPVPHRDPENSEAHSAYQWGNVFSSRYRTDEREEDFFEAEKNYDAALNLEPEFAAIYRAKGDLYEARYVKTDDRAYLSKMDDCYRKAHILDLDRAEFMIGMGLASIYRKDEERACRFLKNAYQIDPGNAEVTIGIGAFLRTIGLYDKARGYFLQTQEISRDLDRLSPEPAVQLASCCWFLAEYDRAAKLLMEILDKDPKNENARIALARQFLSLKRFDEAEAEIRAVKNPDELPPTLRHRYEHVLIWLQAARGQTEKMNALIAESPLPFAYEITNAYCLLGMKDKAIKNIRDGIARGFEKTKDYMYQYPYLEKNPAFDGLRDVPEFKSILDEQKAVHDRLSRIFEPLGKDIPEPAKEKYPRAVSEKS